jgi:uncharacterized protein (DUF952 family)
MTDPKMFHITHAEDWRKAQAEGSYRADSLVSEGFIHCSDAQQIIATANRFYGGVTGLLLLEIDARLLKAEVRRENLEGGTPLFPHIYGPLTLDAVVGVFRFEPDENGRFSLPESSTS